MYKVYTKAMPGNGSVIRGGFDMKVGVITHGTRINVTLSNEALKEFKNIDYFNIGVDVETRRIYAVPDVFKMAGYKIQMEKSGYSGHFQAGNRELVRAIKKMLGDKRYVAGRLHTDRNGYYIEVPE